MLKKLLFRLAKSPAMGWVVGSAFRYGSWALPVRKLVNGRDVLAFAHPQPSYANHLILSPKRPVKNLQRMAKDGFSRYFLLIWQEANSLATRPEYSGGFTLVANGGKRQEVQQVHFHLFTDHPMVSDCRALEEAPLLCEGDVRVLRHPAPEWAVHLVLQPDSQTKEDAAAYFSSILKCIDCLDDQFRLAQMGYSLVHQADGSGGNAQRPVFHIVAGKKLK